MHQRLRHPTGAAWWTKSWNWAATHTDRVCAIAYFNSQHNNNSGNTWVLTESASKLAAYKKSLTSSVGLQALSEVPRTDQQTATPPASTTPDLPGASSSQSDSSSRSDPSG